MSKEQKLLSNSPDIEMGISNPSMEESSDEIIPVNATDEKIPDENEAESFLHNLSARRRRKQKELTKTLKTREDLAEEVRTVKQKSRKALEESVDPSTETTSLSLAQDSTLLTPSQLGDTVDAVPSTSLDTQNLQAAKPPVSPKKSKRIKKLQDDIEVVTEERNDIEDMEDSDLEKGEPHPGKSSIRLRIKSLREKAKSEAASEVNEEVREKRKKMLQKSLRPSVLPEDSEIEKQMSATSKKLHQKWKEMRRLPVQKNYDKPSAKQSMDFFTHMLEEEIPIPSCSATIEETGVSAPEPEPEPEPKILPEETDEDTVLLIDSIDDEEGFALITLVKPDKTLYLDQVEAEAKMYCIPSSQPVPSLEKLDSTTQEPRYLADEGFYVGTPPNIASSNRNRMEQRLMLDKEQGKKWFGEDGRIKSLPDPLKKISSRVPVPEEQELNQHTLYRKALLKEFDSRYIDGMVESKGRYQLDIDINTLSFSQHHLFSKEHVLVTKLLSLYQEYLTESKNNMVEFYTGKLKAAKSSARYFQDQLLKQKATLSDETVSNYEKRLQDYLLDIRHIRSQRDKEDEINMNLLKNIIHTWKQIKTQRERQGFINTPVKLLIHRQDVDRAKDDLQWRQEIEDEVEDLRAIHNEEYERQLRIYQRDFENWETKQRLKKEAVKRKKSRLKKSSKSTPELEDQDLISEDEKILSEEGAPKPILPENFDERGAREKVRSKALKIRRRPGDPKLFPEVLYTANVTPTHQCPRSEQRRQDDVLKYKIFVKILFNSKEVLRTNSKPLTQDFKVTFGQIYNLKIVQWPESVALQIYENTGFTSHQLAELYLNIPEASVTCNNIEMENHEFSCDLKIQFNHEGVGSGVAVNFDSNSENIAFLNTSGILSCSLAWAVDEKGVPLVPPIGTNSLNKLYSACYLDPLAAIGFSGITDPEQLSKWVESSRLDPNDPNNADLIYSLKPRSDAKGKLISPNYFRLEQFQEEFNFCTDEDIHQNKRFQLLKLRDREIPEFCNYKMVPSSEKEIPKNIFKEYDRRKKEEQKIQILEDIEMKRVTVARYIQRIREEVMRRFKIASHRKRREEIINEDAVPNIGMIGESLLGAFRSKHPLKPERKERKRIAQGIKGDEVKILVNVIQAFNIPVRDQKTLEMIKESSNLDNHETMINPYQEQTVHPYLEVSFQRNTVRTHTADGPNPSFNEELIIPFHAQNNNFTPSNLQTISDVLFFNLFDEVLVDILEDDTKQDTEIHQRVERKWLGSLKIPFSTIYFNGKVDGTMCLNAPPLLLGYKYTQNAVPDIDTTVIPLADTYLTLFITIQPTLIPPEPIQEMFSSNEDEKLLLYAKNWQSQLESKWPSRSYKTTVIDITGKSVFITRFFKPLAAPAEFTEGKTTSAATEMILRYVSLIPYVADNFILPGHCDIWSTCEQFLHMLVGDDDEHSVMLANFLLGLGKKTWLCLGSGIPDGLSAYVVTAEGSNFFIWDAKNGKVYDSRSNHLPLQNVGSMVNQENIWANIQSTDIPPRINFNVNDTTCWKPFFHSGYTNPGLSSVQVDSLSYIPTDNSYVIDLQEKIEKTLKTKVTEWRRKYLTRWNRYFTQNIRSLLPKLEENRGSVILAEHLNEMEHQWGSYKVSGFPINLPFTELSNIVEFVYATGVHNNDASNIEFALAVYIHAYPNNVLSVWIYIASLIKQR